MTKRINHDSYDYTVQAHIMIMFMVEQSLPCKIPDNVLSIKI